MNRVGENVLANNLLWSIILYFIQPVFIIGFLYAIFNRNKRVNYTRETFRVNFKRDNFELKDYFLKGLIPGLILSIVSVIAGIPVTVGWYLVYQLLAIVLLLIGGSRFIHPLFTFPISLFILYGLNILGINIPLNWLESLIPSGTFTLGQTMNHLPALMLNLLLLASLILLASTFTMDTTDKHKIYPILKASKRGKNVAKYQKKTLWALPLLVVVPGEIIEPFADWWPLLTINGNQYAFLILPLLVGFHFTVSTQLLEEAATQLQTEFRYLAILGLGLFGLSYLYPVLTELAVALILIGGLIILIRHRRRENMWSFRYGPADEGLRVIAVRADSPGERLNLSIGDIILELNDHHLLDLEEYNKVIATNRSYIKMRIKRKDGEIIIAETPLYDDDHNNLGLLLLEK
jgi:hypothetical protein